MIGFFGTRQQEEATAARKLPAVNVSARLPEGGPLPRVIPGNRAVGRRATNRLLKLGFRSFAVVASGNRDMHQPAISPQGIWILSFCPGSCSMRIFNTSRKDPRCLRGA